MFGFRAVLLAGTVSGGGGNLDGFASTFAGAWSTRKLRAAYSGPCLNARRSSDGAQQDFGFVSGWLDTAGMLLVGERPGKCQREYH